MVLLLIIRLILDLGKDGILKDMEIIHMYRAVNFSISTGRSSVMSWSKVQGLLPLLCSTGQRLNGVGIGDE
jgi:hypothetical protein